MKRWLPFAALAVIAVLAFFSRPESVEPVVDEPEAEAAGPAVQVRTSTGEQAPAAEDADADEDSPELVESRALVAAAEMSGLGVVRCPLPSDVPDEIEVRRLRRVVWTDTGVEGSVQAASGIANMHSVRPPNTLLMEDADLWRELLEEAAVPLGTLEWTDAFPGEVGSCRFVPAERVLLSGSVKTAEGAPADPEDAWLNGCADGSTYLADDGSFEIETWRGAPCRLSVRSGGIPGSGLLVDRSQDHTGLVVTDDDPDPADAMASAREENERLGDMADPFELAAEDPELDADTRALLSEWAAADRDEIERKLEYYAMAEEIFREIPAQEQTGDQDLVTSNQIGSGAEFSFGSGAACTLRGELLPRSS
ncbi:MAG: hypothetical protein GY884_03700 [Proteobacteria bacterium]|nr:hypothetical protein [Pseudomonadota bacterium]